MINLKSDKDRNKSLIDSKYFSIMMKFKMAAEMMESKKGVITYKHFPSGATINRRYVTFTKRYFSAPSLAPIPFDDIDDIDIMPPLEPWNHK